MAEYFVYNHGGSANHGCEALARTVLHLFRGEKPVPLMTESPQQDMRYGVDRLTPLLPATAPYSVCSPSFWKAYAALKRRGDYVQMDVLPYRRAIAGLHGDDVELSIG